MSEKRTLKYLQKMVHADLTKIMQGEMASYPYPWTLGNFEDCLRNHRTYSCWVFELDKEFAGHVILSTGAGEAHILNICVYPEYQNKGWGRKLLAEAEWIAKQYQAENCILEVRQSNKAGIHLYYSEGYNEIGQRKDYYPADKGREDALVMAKTLF
jgi:ribosomal-protein-alanine N-acetyltransferase